MKRSARKTAIIGNNRNEGASENGSPFVIFAGHARTRLAV